MNKNIGIIIGVIVLAVIIGGVYVSQNSKKDTTLAEEKAVSAKEAMAQKDKDAMMKGEGTATDKMKDEKMMGTGVVLMNGAITLEEDGKMSQLTKEYVFESGVTVSLTGNVTKKDGTTVQLKEGESAWADGTITKAGADAMMKKEDDTTMKKGETSMVDKGDTMMKAGSYEAYTPEKVALASATHDVVLFFRASWCPSCRAVDADIKANLSKIPSTLAILDVDYDKSAPLKQKYGVTFQHTFVQVDKDGNLIKKWSGSPTLAALVAEVK